jgi:hypothetical protein
MNPTPLDGRLSITPWTGSAFETEFFLNTTGWIVRHEPAEYQFMYLDSNDQFSVLTPYQSETTLSTLLPPTKEIIVKVKDAKGFVMQGFSVVFCDFVDETKSLE